MLWSANILISFSSRAYYLPKSQIYCPCYNSAWLARTPQRTYEVLSKWRWESYDLKIQTNWRQSGIITPQQCHKLIASIPHYTNAVIYDKRAPNLRMSPLYESGIILTHTFLFSLGGRSKSFLHYKPHSPVLISIDEASNYQPSV